MAGHAGSNAEASGQGGRSMGGRSMPGGVRSMGGRSMPRCLGGVRLMGGRSVPGADRWVADRWPRRVDDGRPRRVECGGVRSGLLIDAWQINAWKCQIDGWQIDASLPWRCQIDGWQIGAWSRSMGGRSMADRPATQGRMCRCVRSMPGGVRSMGGRSMPGGG